MQLSCLTAKDIRGVGLNESNLYILIPFAENISQTISCSSFPLFLQSWPITIEISPFLFIDFKSIPQRLEGNKLYEVIQIADSKINIIYDKNHELGEVLAKAVKNANKNDYAILILRSIICDAIRQTYRSNLSPKKLVDLQNQLMGHPLD